MHLRHVSCTRILSHARALLVWAVFAAGSDNCSVHRLAVEDYPASSTTSATWRPSGICRSVSITRLVSLAYCYPLCEDAGFADDVATPMEATLAALRARHLKHRTNTVQIAYKQRTNSVQTPYKQCTNSVFTTINIATQCYSYFRLQSAGDTTNDHLFISDQYLHICLTHVLSPI